MPTRSSKMPRDPNQLAARIVALSTGQVDDTPGEALREKNPAAVALGRLGGMKGGKARAEKLTAKERSDIGRKAAVKRWADRDQPEA